MPHGDIGKHIRQGDITVVLPRSAQSIMMSVVGDMLPLSGKAREED